MPGKQCFYSSACPWPFNRGMRSPSTTYIQKCIADVSDWCGSRRLQLNESKTEIIWLGSKVTLDICRSLPVLKVCETSGPNSTCGLTLQSQHRRTCTFYQIRRLQQIRCLLGRDVTANLVAAFILSYLDYCNALLAALPYTSMAPLHSTTCL